MVTLQKEENCHIIVKNCAETKMASEDLFADKSEEFSDIIPELETELETGALNSGNGNILEAEEEEDVIEDELAAENEINTIEENANDGVERSSNTNTATESKLFQLPLSRVRNIMKLDPDCVTVSKEAVFFVTRATELFIESLARESYSYTAQTKKKTVQKRDVDLAISAIDGLMFLEGAVNF